MKGTLYAVILICTLSSWWQAGGSAAVPTTCPRSTQTFSPLGEAAGDSPVMPPLAVPPLDAAQARRLQEACSEYQGVSAVGTSAIGVKLAWIPANVFWTGATETPTALVTAAAPTSGTAPRLDRNHLLVYRDDQSIPQPVKSVSDWQRRRAAIVRGMESVMGPLPGPDKRCALGMEIVSEEDRGVYVCRRITYASEPSSRVPAWLLIPKAALAGNAECPAVLCPHPTGPVGDPDYARDLAARGFVTLTANYPWLGKYEPDLKTLGWQSGTMKGIWDNIRGLDLLDSLPYVKHGKYGAIGHSLGGHNSVYTAVFDQRLQVIVSSCGLDSYLDYYGGDPSNWQPERGWCQTRYMLKLADYAGRLEEIPFDFHEMIAALAPRAVFVSAPLGDSNFRWDSVDRIAAAALPVFRLCGKPDNLRVEHPDCGHDFPEAMREIAFRLLEERLK